MKIFLNILKSNWVIFKINIFENRKNIIDIVPYLRINYHTNSLRYFIIMLYSTKIIKFINKK